MTLLKKLKTRVGKERVRTIDEAVCTVWAKGCWCFNEYREQCGDNCGLGSRLETIASSCEHYRAFWMGVDSYRVEVHVTKWILARIMSELYGIYRPSRWNNLELAAILFAPLLPPLFLSLSTWRDTMQYGENRRWLLPRLAREKERNRRLFFSWKYHFLGGRKGERK